MTKIRDENESNREEVRIERCLLRPEQTEDDQEKDRRKRLAIDDFHRVDQRLTNDIECLSSREQCQSDQSETKDSDLPSDTFHFELKRLFPHVHLHQMNRFDNFIH